jgi:hypothetical protein
MGEDITFSSEGHESGELHTTCPYCQHSVPVYVKGDELYIPGHYYTVNRNQAYGVAEVTRQIGGADRVGKRRTHTVSTEEHCDGGSLKIVGFAEKRKSDEPEKPNEDPFITTKAKMGNNLPPEKTVRDFLFPPSSANEVIAIYEDTPSSENPKT